ncbi:hypothetical protein DEO72_LG8g335 [Vigna unguiculata]|uniref:Uncharacterized protein n=1 Tax=Vigna unguiculata TaxID=3917 RepID=A0A4D6MNJ0_VIGUN|nr:hypothetical protein DEO72_LG8g335 [Vigna unguiculata]
MPRFFYNRGSMNLFASGLLPTEAYTFVPASPPLRGGIAGPAFVVQGGRRRRRGGTRSGVELAHGGHQAVAGEPAVAAGELPCVPAEPARGHGVVSEALRFVNPQRSNRLRVVCLEREIGEFVKRGGSGEEVVGVKLKDLEQQPFISPAPPLLRRIFFYF